MKQALNFSHADLLKLPHRGHRSADDIVGFLSDRGYVLNDDQAHRERIHAEIAEGLFTFASSMTSDDGERVIDAIAAGRIRHLTINY
jgi:hypothetical protein